MTGLPAPLAAALADLRSADEDVRSVAYHRVLWTLDTEDGLSADTVAVVRRLVAGLDDATSPGRETVVELLEEIAELAGDRRPTSPPVHRLHPEELARIVARKRRLAERVASGTAERPHVGAVSTLRGRMVGFLMRRCGPGRPARKPRPW